MKVNWLRLLSSLLLCLLAGFVGSLFTVSSISTWYAFLNKPSFSPPNYLFGPVWTTLYLLMGISFYLIWISKKSKKKNLAIKIFLLQLFLNSTWSIIFFGLKNPLFAFINILALWSAIFWTIRKFLPISKNASYLLYPYLAWVSFATALNLAIVLLNR